MAIGVLTSRDLAPAVAKSPGSASLVDRLIQVRVDAANGADAMFDVRCADGPVAAVVAAAVEAGATAVVLDDELAADPDQVRDARRAADVAWALSIERAAQ